MLTGLCSVPWPLVLIECGLFTGALADEQLCGSGYLTGTLCRIVDLDSHAGILYLPDANSGLKFIDSYYERSSLGSKC